MIDPASLMHRFPWGKSGTELFTWVKRRCSSTLAERATGKPSTCPQKPTFISHGNAFQPGTGIRHQFCISRDSACREISGASYLVDAPILASGAALSPPIWCSFVWMFFLLYYGTRYGSNKNAWTHKLAREPFTYSWVMLYGLWMAMGFPNPHWQYDWGYPQSTSGGTTWIHVHKFLGFGDRALGVGQSLIWFIHKIETSVGLTSYLRLCPRSF